MKTNQLNRLQFWKNQPVQFRFYKSETEKTEPNWTQTEKTKKNQKNRAKTEKTEPNRFEPVFVLKNQTEPNRNRSVWTSFGFFKKIQFDYFLDKNRTEPKMTPLVLPMLLKIKISWIYCYCYVWANSKKNLKKEELTLLISHGCLT
jgi:hypothetical protein